MDYTSVDKRVVRINFIEYLKAHYDYSRPDIMASNVFYAYNNNIGMEFWSIFECESNMENGRALLIKKFTEVGRKDPIGHSNVVFGCWVKFKEFLDRS